MLPGILETATRALVLGINRENAVHFESRFLKLVTQNKQAVRAGDDV